MAEDPFAAPVEQRRLDRRLRGRLVAPVTIWTAGGKEDRAALTVSSVLVVEGEPAKLLGVIDPLSDLRTAIDAHRKFTVHVLGDRDRKLAAIFAGVYPLLPFEGVEIIDTDHGPRIAGDRTVACCTFDGASRVGYLDLVIGAIDKVELGADPTRPLAFHRGRYRGLSAP